MNMREAAALLRSAVPPGAATWADLGAGDGTFTRALVELLGAESRIYAVDRDAHAIAMLERLTAGAPTVVALRADFTDPSALTALGPERLDGMLIANALHYVRDVAVVLAHLVTLVRPGGRVVIVEYDRRRATPWVPYPLPSARLPAIAAAADLTPPVITATRPSLFGGTLYVATLDRRA